MMPKSGVISLALAVVACSRSPGDVHVFSAVDRAAVLTTDSAYVRAWLRNDTSAVLNTLAAEAVLMPAGVHPLGSDNAIQAFWWPDNGTHTRITAFTRTVDELRGAADFAYVRGTDSIAFVIDSGASHREQSIRSMTLAIYRRQWNGAWLISRMMWGPVTPTVSFSNEFPAVSPDGQTVAFMSDRDNDPEIYTMGIDGSNPRRLTHSPGRDAHPSWSPDGKHIVFQSPRGDSQPQIYTMDADGANPVKLTNNGMFSGVAVYSPDGSQILYQVNASPSLDSAHWQIYVMRSDGSGQRNLSHNAWNDQVPRWSADGARILFFSDASGRDQVYVMKSDGTDRVRLTNDAWHDHTPVWSHDNKKIAFVSDRGGGWDIYVMGADGTNPVQLTHTKESMGLPAWTPDDSQLVFTSKAGSTRDLFIVRSDGSSAHRIGARS